MASNYPSWYLQTFLIVFDRGSNPRFTVLEAITLTITSQFNNKYEKECTGLTYLKPFLGIKSSGLNMQITVIHVLKLILKFKKYNSFSLMFGLNGQTITKYE